MITYLELLEHVLENGERRDDRTGTGTISVFGYQNRYDMQEGFPIVTTKKVFWRGIVEEFLWMVVRGSTDVSELEDRGINFWSPWKGEDNTIGPGYGKQFRNWEFVDLGKEVDQDIYHAKQYAVDQVDSLIEGLQNNPESRRHVISLWNAAKIAEMELPPCHGLVIQFYVRPIPEKTLEKMIDNIGPEHIVNDIALNPSKHTVRELAERKYKLPVNYLDCQMYQRSADIFIGVPFNISFYSLFTHVVAKIVGMEPGEFVHSIGDAHIYQNHTDQVEEQLSREPYDLPTLELNPIDDIDNLTWDDAQLNGYEYHPAIKAPVAV